MRKISTVHVSGNVVFKSRKSRHFTIGLDLGDRWSFYCLLDKTGNIILEQN